MLLFVDVRIKTSKNGISILLLFTVKRIWSFKEERNVFYFDGKLYRQKRGTAMGMAPTYATLVLGYLEHISDVVQCFVYFPTKMLLQKFPNRAEYLHKDLQHQN
jgi:hypothetical protein